MSTLLGPLNTRLAGSDALASGLARVSLCVLAALLLQGAVGPLAAQPPEPPPFYAIRDVRVVPVSGEPIERATVLIADGLIDDIGIDLVVPPDAWVIEGEGLTLYPGLIDARTGLGLRQEEASAGGGPPGRGSDAPPIRGPQDRPSTEPWQSAADLLTLEDGRLEKWRVAGFTAVHTTPTGKIFPGQGAVISTAGVSTDDLVVASTVTQRVELSGGGGFRSFPGSLMGVLSYLRQTFLDARHYGEAHQLYEQEPRGRERPEYDRTLAPLHQALEAGTPFVWPAQHPHEIDRALALSSELSVPIVIEGGHGAWARAGQLAERRIPVLLQLPWPEAPRDRDPDADEPFPAVAQRELAPATPARLAAAGVPFAFASLDGSTPDDVLEGVRRAVDTGLDPTDALEGLTLGAARILGVDDRLGSIERGKIADLILANADPWSEEVEIAAVFVDGRLYRERPDESEEDREPPASDPSGIWTLTVDSPRGARESTAEITMAENGDLSGEVTSERGTTSIDEGSVSGDRLRFVLSMDTPGGSVEAVYRGTLEGETLAGSVTAGPMSFELSGERTSTDAAGEGRVGVADGEPRVPLEELESALETYRGPVRRMDDYAIRGATVWTNTGEPVPDATVVVEDGKIAAVGPDVAVPRGYEVIDATGRHLIPGIIDAHSHIAIEGGVNEGTLAVTAMVTVEDVIDPTDVGIYRALAGGVTSANLLHGSANPIGGRNAVIKLRWGSDASGLRFSGAPPGIKFALGENPKRSRSFPGMSQRYPATRMGVIDVIRDAFTRARQYREDWRRYEDARTRGERPIPPRRDLELEALVEILEGDRLVHAHCYRADEILQLLRLAEEQDFRIATLQHVLEGYKVADEIAEHGAGASTFSDWWGYKVEAWDAIPYNAALMAERGVLVSINSDSGEEMRHLNQEAAKTIKWGGMTEVEALELVTLHPARQLGIADRVGSIEVGKDADLVLYDGPPLSVFSRVEKTFVDGDLYFDLDADRERQRTIEELERRLAGEDDSEEEAPTDIETPTTPDVQTPVTDPRTSSSLISALVSPLTHAHPFSELHR